MKVVKVDDDIHHWLKLTAELAGMSINDVLVQLEKKYPVPTDLNKVMDQIMMIHKRFDALEDSLSSFSFSEPSPEYESPEDARRREIERLRAMDEFQHNAISHPEDEVQ